MPKYTAVVTLLSIVLYFFFATQVSRARRRFGVKLPAMSGSPEFERIHRVHMNTLEWMPMYLVTLWLFAFYLSDLWAAVLGLLWIMGRVAYFVGYRQAVEKRGPGFAIQATAVVALFIGAIVGIVLHW